MPLLHIALQEGFSGDSVQIQVGSQNVFQQDGGACLQDVLCQLFGFRLSVILPGASRGGFSGRVLQCLRWTASIK